MQSIPHRTGLLPPVDRPAEIGHRLQHVERRTAVRRQAGLVERRHGDQPGRVGHQPALIEQRLEGRAPLLTEVDVVVGDGRLGYAADADVPDHRRR